MKIIATTITAKDLRPGDLFSTANQTYWDLRDRNAVGEKVFIRTESACPSDQADEVIHRITVEDVEVQP